MGGGLAWIIGQIVSIRVKTLSNTTLVASSHIIERFLYDLEMKTRKQNRNNKRKGIEHFDWFIEWIKTRGLLVG